MVQPGNLTSHIRRVQVWLEWALPLSFAAVLVINVVGARLSIHVAYFIAWFLFAAAWTLIGFAWGYIIFRYPQQLVGPTRAAVERVGKPRLYALLVIWGYTCSAVLWITLGMSTLAGTSIPMEVFDLGALVAFVPAVVLEAYGWAHSYPERKQARAAARQAREALAMMLTTANGQPGGKYTRWRDRWRNRVRRAQHRQTRG